MCLPLLLSPVWIACHWSHAPSMRSPPLLFSHTSQCIEKNEGNTRLRSTQPLHSPFPSFCYRCSLCYSSGFFVFVFVVDTHKHTQRKIESSTFKSQKGKKARLSSPQKVKLQDSERWWENMKESNGAYNGAESRRVCLVLSLRLLQSKIKNKTHTHTERQMCTLTQTRT